MTGCHPSVAFALRLAAAAPSRLALALAVGLAFEPASGWAQTHTETTIQAPIARKPKVTPRRPVAAETPLDDPDQPVERPTPPPDDGDDERLNEEDARAGRLSASAGDASRDLAPEPRAPVDGVIDDGDLPPVVDGIPNLARDPRRPEDIAAFSQPPSGYDALAFQIELNPFTDRRIDRLFRFEPYDPTGIRIGSFVLFPEAEFGSMWNSNVFRNSANLSDVALTTRGSVRAVSDWRMHALELRAAGNLGFYDEFSTENDKAWSVDARGRIDIARFTNVEALVSHQMDKDVRALLDSPANAIRRGDVETNRVAAAFNHMFNRLSVQLRGSLTEVDFAPVPSIGGGIINNADRNYTQHDIAARVSWALNRYYGVFTEVSGRERDYATAPPDGILRSSTGEQVRTGLTFAPWGPTLRGEVGAGWGRQDLKQGNLGGIDGFLIDANLAWRASPLTTFLLTVRSDFYDTTAASSPGTLSRQTGVEVRHAFRRHLIGTASVRYTVAPYEGIDLKDQDITSEVGLEYYLGRNVILFGRYQHVDFHSTEAGRDYGDDIVRVGVRVRQ